MTMRPLNRKLAAAAAVILPLLAPVAALADDVIPDARQIAFPTTVPPFSGSVALIWLLLIVLGGFGMGILFISSNRSHLD